MSISPQKGVVSAKNPKTPFISKSKYLEGLQCHKLLWFRYNAKDQLPPVDEATQAIFDQGKEVGDLAKKLFPSGIEVQANAADFKQLLVLSKEAVQKRRPLFEAAFEAQGAYARADILNPVSNDQWDIIEVKSSTEVKDVNLHDVALQRFVYEGAGLKIRKCFLLHINSDYVRHGKVDPKKLFVQADITDQVVEILPSIPSKLQELFTAIRLKKAPVIQIGKHCDDPYTCILHDQCWAFLPDYNVFSLYRSGKKSYDLFQRGILKLKDIPDDVKLTDAQTIQRQAVTNGQAHIDKRGISAFLKGLKYPISYLDFETFGTAIPLFDHVKPYQQIPFQFSLHVVSKKGAAPIHRGFLADGKDDPRPKFLMNLQEALPSKGSIVTYNASFELNVLKACCEVYKEFASWFKELEPRIVDLWVPFRSFNYYHPAQDGSASMKAVLPALVGKNYEHLDIQEGGTASREYLRVTFTDVPQVERQRVRKGLEKYCGLDTEGMIWIVEKLGRL